jgi:hypothetical protein
MRTRILPALFGLGLGFAVAAVAQTSGPQPAPRCESEMTEVQRMMAETPMPPAKEAQIKALLEQVARACKENNEVVAMAGIDQIKAIIEEQRKQAG